MTARRKKVTAAQAKLVLAHIVAKFGEGAELIKDFDAGYGKADYAIVWEGGEFGWSYGVESNVVGVWTEAATSWCLNIYTVDAL